MATTITPPSAPMVDTNSMLAGIGSDFFADAGSISIPASDDTGVADETSVTEDPAAEASAESPSIEDPSGEVAIDEPPVESETSSDTTDSATTEATSDEPEEGVIRTKEKDGKYKFRLDENRWNKFHGEHVLLRDAAELIGEPLTLEGIEHFHQVSAANDRLWDSVTSGDPAQQAAVLNEFITEMKNAQSQGETGVDPTIPFANTVYATLRDQAPDAFAHLRLQGARDLLSEMFENAAANKNSHLFSSAQHIAATLAGVGPKPENVSDADYAAFIKQAADSAGIPFHTLKDMDGLVRTEKPLSADQRRIQELESQLSQRSGPSQTEQFTTWSQSNKQSVNAAVFEDAVKPTLSSVENSWKEFPDDYQRLVVDPLNSAITKALGTDQDLIQKTRELRARAHRATSEEVRQQIGADIQKLYVNRARIAADKVKTPILNSAANALKGLSVQNNTRRAAAQNRTAPSGTGTPVRQSVLPTNIATFKNGMYDSGTAMKQAIAALSR